MATKSQDQLYPQHAREASSYVLVGDAKNTSREDTHRASRWPTIVKYSGVSNGISRAYKEGGVTRRHLHQLERHGQLTLNTSESGAATPTALLPAAIASRKRVVPERDESRYPEGAESYRTHRTRERDSALATAAKKRRLTDFGTLACDVCTFDFTQKYGVLGGGFIEAHHTVPVSKLDGTTKTRVSDLALVCSNCHRMLHRLCSRWLQWNPGARDSARPCAHAA